MWIVIEQFLSGGPMTKDYWDRWESQVHPMPQPRREKEGSTESVEDLTTMNCSKQFRFCKYTDKSHTSIQGVCRRLKICRQGRESTKQHWPQVANAKPHQGSPSQLRLHWRPIFSQLQFPSSFTMKWSLQRGRWKETNLQTKCFASHKIKATILISPTTTTPTTKKEENNIMCLFPWPEL